MSHEIQKDDKDTMLDKLYDKYEVGLEFIGCSAIED